MPSRSNRRHSLFITLPTALAALAYLWFVFVPTAKALRNIHDQIRDKESFIAQTDALHTSAAHVEHDLAEVQQYTQDWCRQTPAPGQLEMLFEKITDYIRRSGVISTRFEPLQEVSLEIIHRMPVRMEVTGSYAQIFRLLASLERLPETVWVEELKIEKSKESGKDVQCELKLEVFAVDSKESG
ncbi:MAG TPA: type 4a pilus biogenesis protein PilO [Pirellulales bacterium]|jgi:Tfp pilus assembly protein PilO|nr:type 4a pilus biogenesis protein PilO [Pirellulales bacterium]